MYKENEKKKHTVLMIHCLKYMKTHHDMSITHQVNLSQMIQTSYTVINENIFKPVASFQTYIFNIFEIDDT